MTRFSKWVSVLGLSFGFVMTSTHVADSYYVNSVNFLGAKAVFDSEAEFRLLRLGRSIVYARQAGTNLSLAVKGAYGASITNDLHAQNSTLDEAFKLGHVARRHWANVAKEFSDVSGWLDGIIRPEYAKAFCEVALPGKFHNSLVQKGISASYMLWSFQDIAGLCKASKSPEEAILSVFERLEGMAKTNASNTEIFISYLIEISGEEGFSLYRYIFNHLALQAKKPKLFSLDEQFFKGVSEFDIFYEALEQISRETHTLIPGTHDQFIGTFDLRFTKDPGKPK